MLLMARTKTANFESFVVSHFECDLQLKLIIFSVYVNLTNIRKSVCNVAVTCEIKLFLNYFTGLLQLMNIFQHVQCGRNSFEIISELLQRLK